MPILLAYILLFTGIGAFFFPWAVVFGKANTLAGNSLTLQQRAEAAKLMDPNPLPADAKGLKEMSDEALYAAAVQRKEEAFREKVARLQRAVEERSADR